MRITALGTQRGLETRLVPARGYDLALITPVPLPRKPSRDLLRLPSRVRRAVRQTRSVLSDVEADVVVGFGGYVALPAYLAARGGVLRRRPAVPVVVHEANASAGLANRVGARSAERVLAAVPDPGLRRVEVVGTPVREAITSLDRSALRAAARAEFGFAEDARVLLVFGGSQGAQSINRAVSGAAKALAATGVSVLHAHGPKNTLELGDPAGGGLLVDDADLSADCVADTVAGLLTDDARLASMTAAAALSGHRDAAEQVAKVALDVARTGRKKLR